MKRHTHWPHAEILQKLHFFKTRMIPTVFLGWNQILSQGKTWQ